MGNFYTNFTIFDADVDVVIAAAKELGRRAYVVKSGNDVVLFDRDCDEQNTEEIKMLGTALSTKLELRILGCLNHDDDDLLLWIFEPKSSQLFYESIADAPRFAWGLSKFRGGLLTCPIVLVALAWPIVIFQIFRHHLLGIFITLPRASIGFGYTYLSKGEIPPGFSAEDLKLI